MTTEAEQTATSRQQSRVEISKRLVLVNSACTVGTRPISITVLFWMHQYLLLRISPSEYALYPVIASVMAFTPILSAVLTGGVARHIIAAYTQGDEWRVTQIV